MLQLILVSLAAVALYVLLMILVGLVVGVIYRFIMTKYVKNPRKNLSKNIGVGDRWVRFGLSIVFFFVGLFNLSNPIFLIVCGFLLYETFSSWCGLFAVIGKSSCPIK